jgi:putative component of membrane protein insertase Oxa1/YidC/SpoIIIJ protein YidD
LYLGLQARGLLLKLLGVFEKWGAVRFVNEAPSQTLGSICKFAPRCHLYYKVELVGHGNASGQNTYVLPSVRLRTIHNAALKQPEVAGRSGVGQKQPDRRQGVV